MSTPLPPWVTGPLELLVHAEQHLRDGNDFDRRIALISFDNAIEVAIATYLTLNPIQRGNRTYPKADVEKWTQNFHAKLDFLDCELSARGMSWKVDRTHIMWAHDHRNEQYHGGHKGTPEKQVLDVARNAAIWVFGLLFEVADPEAALGQEIAGRTPPASPSRARSFDIAIDTAYPPIQVGVETYYASELLFAVDPTAYRDLGGKVGGTPSTSPSDAEKNK